MTVTSLFAVPFPVLALGLLGLTAVLYVALRWRDARRAGGAALTGRPGALAITAVVLVLIGLSLFLVGWVVGCVLLWVSPRWRWTDKLLGTLAGGGLAPYLFALANFSLSITGQVCTGGSGTAPTCINYGPPPWVGDTAVVISFLGQVAVAVWLLRRAGRQPGRTITAAPLS